MLPALKKINVRLQRTTINTCNLQSSTFFCPRNIFSKFQYMINFFILIHSSQMTYYSHQIFQQSYIYIPKNVLFYLLCVLAKLLQSRLFVTLWTVDRQAPLSMGFFPWDSSGKNTGVGCHFLLQGIFLAQESSPCILHLLLCRWILYH